MRYTSQCQPKRLIYIIQNKIFLKSRLLACDIKDYDEKNQY